MHKTEEKKQERKESDGIIDLEELLIDEEKPKETKKEEKPKKKINITKKEKFEINANIEPNIITELINTEIKNPEKPLISKKTFKFETIKEKEKGKKKSKVYE